MTDGFTLMLLPGLEGFDNLRGLLRVFGFHRRASNFPPDPEGDPSSRLLKASLLMLLKA